MTIRRRHVPETGGHIFLGRNRPLVAGARLHFKDFLPGKTVPSFPASGGWLEKAMPAIRNPMLNNRIGDCVIAAGFKIRALTSAYSGKLWNATDAQIVHDYGAIGGYVPGNESTDQGCDEQTAMSYWTQTGFPDGHKLLGWMAVDATRPDLYKYATFLEFCPLFGVELPDPWYNGFTGSDGFIWDIQGSPDPGNGHAYPGIGWDTSSLQITTWGCVGRMTDRAIAKYAGQSAGGELYLLVSDDIIASGQAKSPSGLDWQGLKDACQAYFGETITPPDNGGGGGGGGSVDFALLHSQVDGVFSDLSRSHRACRGVLASAKDRIQALISAQQHKEDIPSLAAYKLPQAFNMRAVLQELPPDVVAALEQLLAALVTAFLKRPT